MENVIWEWRFLKKWMWSTWDTGAEIDILWIDQGVYGFNIAIIDTPPAVDITSVYDEWLENSWVELIDSIIQKWIDEFSANNLRIDEIILQEDVSNVWQEMYSNFWALIDWFDSFTDHTEVVVDDVLILWIAMDVLEWYEEKVLKVLNKKYKIKLWS